MSKHSTELLWPVFGRSFPNSLRGTQDTMQPLNVYLAEEVAAAHVRMEANDVVLQDTVERLRMCVAEVGRLNRLLNTMEEQLQMTRIAYQEEMTYATRLKAENRTMKGMIRTMRSSLDRYRTYAKGKRDAPRPIPEGLQPFMERRRDRLEDEVQRIRRRLDFEQVEETESEGEGNENSDEEPEMQEQAVQVIEVIDLTE